MSKFDVAPPLKRETVVIPEWEEQFGTVELTELTGEAGQKMLELQTTATEGKISDPEFYAELLSLCCTIGGERPPIEWLKKAAVPTLSLLGKKVFEINGISLGAQEKLEKN